MISRHNNGEGKAHQVGDCRAEQYQKGILLSRALDAVYAYLLYVVSAHLHACTMRLTFKIK